MEKDNNIQKLKIKVISYKNQSDTMINFDFVYSIDKYISEMQTWLIKTLTFTNEEYDDRYTLVKIEKNRYGDNVLFDDIWLLE